MNGADANAPELSPEHIDKGKRRAAEATERTPLLVSSSGSPYTSSEEAGHPAESSRGLRRKLTRVFFISLVVCIAGFAILGLLAWSYVSKVSTLDPNEIIHQDVIFSGPDSIEVINVSQAGIWLNIKGKVGVDAGKAIGVGNQAGDGVLDYLRKAVGRWSVRTLDRVTVNMTTIRIAPDYDPTETLLNFDIPPIELPLTVDPPGDQTWLTTLSSPVLMRPTSNRTVLLGFLKESWRRGRISVHAHVEQAFIRGGALDEVNWRNIFSKNLVDVRTIINMKLPTIPGIPGSGGNTPFPSVSKLVTLTSFSVTSESDALSLRGTATAINPVPYDLDLSAPSLPFDVSMLPTNSASPAIHVASVSTLPFTLTHPNITLSLQGSVPAISAAAVPLLSKFISRYLAGQSNNVLIESPLIPSLSAEVVFPGPNPRPNILRNVTIKNMKIKPIGNVFLASGVVRARAFLPKGMNVDVDVFRVLPDVLVFDGEAPSGLEIEQRQYDEYRFSSPPPETPLPDPLPANAFGHIRPGDWLPSLCVPIEPEGSGDGSAYEVSATVVDVPLEVLPGRQKEFSHFVKQVIFGPGGATAGIMGNAAVTISVDGIPLDNTPGANITNLVLTGLPFQGRVQIGKKTLLRFDDDEPNREHARERWKRTWKQILRKIKERLPLDLALP